MTSKWEKTVDYDQFVERLEEPARDLPKLTEVFGKKSIVE